MISACRRRSSKRSRAFCPLPDALEGRHLLSVLAPDYNGDGRADIAFHRPGGGWASVPALFANGNGSWLDTNYAVPSWANVPGAVALTGDYNGDVRTDIAFHRPGGGWASVPVLFAN